MRRGFKAEAERRADTLRRKLELSPTDALDPVGLAQMVGAEVRCADELTSVSKLERLEAIQPGAFSACTFTVADRHVIVYSPLASLQRRNSDVTHEVAHIVLEHDVGQVETIGKLTFFTCDPDQEQEANWLAGCLLLPRPLLLKAVKSGMTAADVAKHYEVSEQMAGFRIRTTGVERQIGAVRQRR